MQAELTRLQVTKPETQLQHQWIPYRSISKFAKQAVIASEDSNFSLHDGVDWEALQKAAQENSRAGKKKRGGSTISMQLSRNLFLSADKSYLRKVAEIILTWKLELVLDKKRILELYLNTAEWGIGVFGIEAAAQHYFGIGADQLNAPQAAWLAAILPAPRRFDRQRASEYVTRQAQVILSRMPIVILP